MYTPHYWTDNCYKETVVNRTLLSLHEGSCEITLTVPLKGLFLKVQVKLKLKSIKLFKWKIFILSFKTLYLFYRYEIYTHCFLCWFKKSTTVRHIFSQPYIYIQHFIYYSIVVFLLISFYLENSEIIERNWNIATHLMV